MKYYIRRDINEYGPYTLADLQRYVAQGNISLTDLTRSEGMNDWIPVSQVLGNIPAPSAPATPAAPVSGTVYSGPAASTTVGTNPSAGGTVYGGPPAYGGPAGYGGAANVSGTPVPADFHWALVLLIGIVTCGIFFWVWFLIESAYVRKIRPQSNGLILAIAALICSVGGQILRITTVFSPHHYYTYGWSPFGSLLGLGTIVLIEVAAFTMKSDLEEYYNSVEPIGLRLNGVMVFFFAVFYFQHHFSRISRWKKTGILEPQA